MSKATSKSKTTITIAAIIIVLIISVAAAGPVKIAYSQSSNTPDFSLKTLNGKLVSLESFKGKPLVLWFMATWCPSCVGQAGAIKQVSSEYGNKLNVLVIDLWAAQNIGGQSAQGFNAETGSDLQAFIAKYGSPQWNAALDIDRVAIKYGITQVDSTVLIDSTGKIVFENLGPSGYQPLKDAAAKIIV